MIKLPDNPEDRKKAIAAIAVGGLALLYVLFAFGIQPYRASLTERKERSAELEDKIWRAQKDLDGMDPAREKNNAIVARILVASEQDRHILRPSLGNYLLVATDLINRAAAGLAIQINTINELPRATQSTKKGNASSSNRFASYTVNLSLTSGLHELARFIHRLESDNPYITVTRLIIMEQSAVNPERHFTSLHLQWPIWADEEQPQRLQAEQIADEERQ